MSKMPVSIILPAYKKEKYIKSFINSVVKVMESSRWDYEIIVVVDGFLDKSFERAQEVAKKNKKIKVFGYENNWGKGYAIRYGMARAKGDPVLFMDITKKINPIGITLLLEHMEWYKADIIVASKRHPASRVEYTRIRRLYSIGYQVLNFILFGLKVRDTQVGLKVYRREVLEKVLPRLVVKAYAFDIEVLAVANYLGFSKMYDAPVELDFEASESKITDEGGSNILLFTNKEVRDMLYDTISIYYRMYFLGYYRDKNKRKWTYEKELQMRVNTGE